MHFGNSKEAIERHGESLKRTLIFTMITVSILMLIGSFHLFLYWFHSRDRSNLFMAFFILTLAGQTFTWYLPTYTHFNLEMLIFDNLLNIFFGSFWIPSMMLAYYSVFYAKMPNHVWFYFILTPFTGYIWIYHNAHQGSFIVWPILISFWDIMRLYIKSAKKKKAMCGSLVWAFYLASVAYLYCICHGYRSRNRQICFYYILFFWPFPLQCQSLMRFGQLEPVKTWRNNWLR